MFVRVDGVFVLGENGQLRHVSRHVCADLTEVEAGGPWRLALSFVLRNTPAGLKGLKCAVTLPRGAGVFAAGPSTEGDIDFAGTLHVVRGRVVVETPASGTALARHEAS